MSLAYKNHGVGSEQHTQACLDLAAATQASVEAGSAQARGTTMHDATATATATAADTEGSDSQLVYSDANRLYTRVHIFPIGNRF